MIKLFDHFNDNSRKLYQSFKASTLEDDLTIVLNDNGFYQMRLLHRIDFLRGLKTLKICRHDFFNQINVPTFWEIKGNNNSAVITDMGRVRGKIFYQSAEKPRIVNRVEWYDEQQRVRFIDHYSKQGIKFAQTILI